MTGDTNTGASSGVLTGTFEALVATILFTCIDLGKTYIQNPESMVSESQKSFFLEGHLD